MTKIKVLLSIFSLLLCTVLLAQDYAIVSKGDQKNITLDQLVDSIKGADVVLFGEYHDDSICHLVQYELARKLYEFKKNNLVVGSEMFESDNQFIIDEYFNDIISQKSFETECRVWSNYQNDYKPILEFCKENEIEYIATNIPRRYASVVYKKGFEGLNDLPKETRKEYIAKLPIPYDKNLESYKEMLEMMHGNENLPKAQAIKDATMASFILENWKKGMLFYHLNGCYHSDYYEGIYWYLKKYNSKLKVVTISILRQEDEIEEKERTKADFILYVE